MTTNTNPIIHELVFADYLDLCTHYRHNKRLKTLSQLKKSPTHFTLQSCDIFKTQQRATLVKKYSTVHLGFIVFGVKVTTGTKQFTFTEMVLYENN